MIGVTTYWVPQGRLLAGVGDLGQSTLLLSQGQQVETLKVLQCYLAT